MEITLNTQEIKKPLEIVSGGVEINTNHLILSHVLIETNNQKLTLTTTNSEIEITNTTNINAKENIKFNICLKDLINLISILDDNANINFLIDNNQIIITTLNNVFKLNTIIEQEFHQLITNKKDILKDPITIPTKQLIDLINKTKFSIANDNPQRYLNGLYLILDNNNITTVSSDGHRLSLANIIQNNNITNKKTAVIPKKTIEEISKILKETKTDNITINISQDYIVIHNDTTQIISKLIDENYPEYEKIIPQQSQNKIIINKKDFDAALKQTEIFVKQTNTIKLIFKNNNLNIIAISEKGEANTKIKIKNYTGEMIAGFNVRYLIETLKKLTTENIIFSINNDENKIALLTNDKIENYKYIIMAVKL